MSKFTKEQMPEVDRLFKQLERGEMPNFLELLSALSNVSDCSGDENSGPRVCNYPVFQPGQACQNCG